jgi:hypothetical protein
MKAFILGFLLGFVITALVSFNTFASIMRGNANALKTVLEYCYPVIRYTECNEDWCS